MHVSRKLCLALAVLALAQAAYYYPRLPDPVASHFDGAGQPNAWSSPGGFFAVMAGVVMLNLLVFVVLAHFIAAGRLGLRLPNREHWLAPARREQTLAVLANFLGWFGVASLLLAVVVVQMVVEANLAQTPLSAGIVWVLIAYYAYVIVSLVRLFRYFRRP